MREYTIALPMATNTGADYGLERARWEHAAERLAGGYTKEAYPAKGVWVAPDGIVYHDLMQAYHVATSAATMQELIGLAFDLFPDQLAFYTVKGGTVAIHNRHERKLKHELSTGIEPPPHWWGRITRQRDQGQSQRPIWRSLKSAMGFIGGGT